jgi:hypothetical protein
MREWYAERNCASALTPNGEMSTAADGSIANKHMDNINMRLFSIFNTYSNFIVSIR